MAYLFKNRSGADLGTVRTTGVFDVIAESDQSLTPDSWTKSFNPDSTNEYAVAGDNINLDGSTSFSMGYWIKSAFTSGTYIALSKIKGSSPYNGWESNFRSTGKPEFYLFNTLTSNALDVVYTGTIAINTWVHIAWTYDGSKSTSGFTLYVNGVAKTVSNGGLSSVTNNLTGSSDSTGLNFYINARQGTNYATTDLLLKEIAIWTSTELTASDVSEYYNSGNPVNSMGMTNPPDHRYTCGDTTGDDATGTTGRITDDGSAVTKVHFTPFNTESADFVSDVPPT